MAKSKSVDNHCLMTRANFIVLSSTHNWVDGMREVYYPGNKSRYPAILQNKTWEMRGISSYAGSFIFVMGKDRADLAAASAFSLPGMFT